MLYEEELCRKGKLKSYTKTKATSLCAKEEERDKRIFQQFPRKTRTLVKKLVSRRNSQQNAPQMPFSSRNPLQFPSSSSSLLFDLNPIPADDSEMNNPKNPCSSSSFLLDPTTIAADSKTKYPRNPNVASSSSSFHYKISAESEMRNPRNPNSRSSPSSCRTEKTSRKRRAVQEPKRNGKCKKPNIEAFSWIGREIPESLKQMMQDTRESVAKWGKRSDLIFQRTLYMTDVNPGESRLSMPSNELIHKDFLTPVESRVMEEDINNVKKMGIGAILIDPMNVKWGMMLKRWEMKKESGKGSWNYNLTCGWNDIVEGNRLKEGDSISIWSFRWGGLLCFALVTPPSSSTAQSNSISLTS